MISGAITGDIIGSVYERSNIKNTDFPLFKEYSRFTDDSVLTVATMENLLSEKKDYTFYYQKYARKYPHSGFGGYFKRKWMFSENPQPYNSWGNGSAMRVSPVGWFFPTLEETMEEARCSAVVTHNHPEGIKGAQAVAAAIFLARTGTSKIEIKQFIETEFAYNLGRTCNDIRPNYHFDVSCQGSVPEAIIAFLESTDFEHAIRLAVSLGGDSDTIAAITGGIAEAFYSGIPANIAEEVEKRLPDEWKIIIRKFSNFTSCPA
jgi:ADP-ribosylglycohydrolase